MSAATQMRIVRRCREQRCGETARAMTRGRADGTLPRRFVSRKTTACRKLVGQGHRRGATTAIGFSSNTAPRSPRIIVVRTNHLVPQHIQSQVRSIHVPAHPHHPDGPVSRTPAGGHHRCPHSHRPGADFHPRSRCGGLPAAHHIPASARPPPRSSLIISPAQRPAERRAVPMARQQRQFYVEPIFGTMKTFSLPRRATARPTRYFTVLKCKLSSSAATL